MIIFNDFEGSDKEIPLATLLGLFDPFEAQIPVKGGFVPNSAKYLIFTSNKHPRNWYEHERYNENQLCRRFKHVEGIEAPTGVRHMETRPEFKEKAGKDAEWDDIGIDGLFKLDISDESN